MMKIIRDPNIWTGAPYPYVKATFQVGRLTMTGNLHNQLSPIFAEGRGEKREAVPMIFLDSAALWGPSEI